MNGHTEKRIYTSSGGTGGGKRRKEVYVPQKIIVQDKQVYSYKIYKL